MVRHLKSGSVLILALLVTAMIAIFVGAMSSYFVTMARLSNGFVVERSVPRQAGMVALESVKREIADMITTANAASAIRTDGDLLDFVGQVEEKIEQLNGSDDYFGGAYHVVLSYERLTKEDPETGTLRQLLKITAKVYEKGKSYAEGNELAVLEMIVEFWGASPSELSLPKIFDYVYFVDNYGHLESESIIVNGDAHANNRFIVKGAVVNGVVSAASNTVTATSARAWPATTYARQIRETFANATMTQVRPEKPIKKSDGISVTWSKGYDPVVLSNPYAGDYADVAGGRPVDTLGNQPTFQQTFPGTYQPSESSFMPSGYSQGRDGKNYYYYFTKYTGAVVKTDSYLLESSAKIARDTTLASKRNDAVKEGKAAYQAALADFNTKMNYYNTVTLKPWSDLIAQQQAWDAAAQDWKDKRTFWAQDYDNGLKEADLAKARTERNAAFIKNNDELVKMLNVSEVDKYKGICTGTLTCENSYKKSGTKTRIAWKHRDQIDRCKMIVYKYDANVFNSTYGQYLNKGLEDSFVAKAIQATKKDGSNPWSQVAPHPMKRELAPVNISGCIKDFYPFSNYKKPCTYTGSFVYLYHANLLNLSKSEYITRNAQVTYPSIPDAVKALEKNSVILIGTDDYPIILNGPVYVDGDVVIRGRVSGRGTIYSGRNIHIIGDILYKKPPSWPYDKTGLSQTQSQIDNANKSCDILMLAARGNIVVGDYTSTTWADSKNTQFLQCLYSESSGYGDTYDDEAIGYSYAFKNKRDYTALDGGRKPYFIAASENDTSTMYANAPWYFLEYVQEDRIEYYAPKLAAPSSNNRRFYECVLGDEVITGLKQLDQGEAEEPWQAPFGNATAKENGNSGDITQIDAILFANHGILGIVGGTTSHKFVLNGAMSCRDEALFPSFDARFKGVSSPTPRVWPNWDMRFITDDLTDWVAIAEGGGCVSNKVSSWRQVK